MDWDSWADGHVLDVLGLGQPPGRGQDPVQLAVGVRGVVVRQQQPLYARLGGHVHGEGRRRVPPVGLGGELVVGVLPVVHQQVRVPAQLEHGLGNRSGGPAAPGGPDM